MRIAQGNDQFIVEKLREPESGLPEEEVSILENVCLATAYKYRFSSTDSGSIPYAHRKFRLVITASAVPQFLSSHFELWLFGVIISLAILGEALISLPSNGVRLTIGGLAYLCFWILLGGVALISAVRTWPPTLKKLAFLFPGSRATRKRFTANDLFPLWCSLAAAFGFLFLWYLTSTHFAELAVAAFAMIAAFRHFLTTPTRAGLEKISELEGFREFLARTDSDKLTRENEPDKTPEMFEAFSGYAVALKVEHGWGEEFALIVSRLIELDQAYGLTTPAWNRKVKIKEPFDELSDDVIPLGWSKSAGASRSNQRRRVAEDEK